MNIIFQTQGNASVQDSGASRNNASSSEHSPSFAETLAQQSKPKPASAPAPEQRSNTNSGSNAANSAANNAANNAALNARANTAANAANQAQRKVEQQSQQTAQDTAPSAAAKASDTTKTAQAGDAAADGLGQLKKPLRKDSKTAAQDAALQGQGIAALQAPQPLNKLAGLASDAAAGQDSAAKDAAAAGKAINPSLLAETASELAKGAVSATADTKLSATRLKDAAPTAALAKPTPALEVLAANDEADATLPATRLAAQAKAGADTADKADATLPATRLAAQAKAGADTSTSAIANPANTNPAAALANVAQVPTKTAPTGAELAATQAKELRTQQASAPVAAKADQSGERLSSNTEGKKDEALLSAGVRDAANVQSAGFGNTLSAAQNSAMQGAAQGVGGAAGQGVANNANLAGNLAANTGARALGLAPAVGSEQWGKALSQQLVSLSQVGKQSVALELNPPGLGPLKVSLSMSDQQMQAVFVSAHQSVRNAIEAALPELRASLANNGISLGNTSVNSGSGQQQASYSQNQQSQAGYKSYENSLRDDTAPVLPGTSPALRTPRGASLDTYA
jgi:flagellar hook-length control protein FliK